MIKINTSGFKEFERKLKNIENNAQRLEGKNSIPLTELFPSEFIKKYTEFSSIEDMFNKSPFLIESAEDFAAIEDELWDHFIKSSTSFNSWKQMQEAATVDWTKKQLGF
jgi:hypothetical protein